VKIRFSCFFSSGWKDSNCGWVPAFSNWKEYSARAIAVEFLLMRCYPVQLFPLIWFS
jgi:hypothetical protein